MLRSELGSQLFVLGCRARRGFGGKGRLLLDVWVVLRFLVFGVSGVWFKVWGFGAWDRQFGILGKPIPRLRLVTSSFFKGPHMLIPFTTGSPCLPACARSRHARPGLLQQKPSGGARATPQLETVPLNAPVRA